MQERLKPCPFCERNNEIIDMSISRIKRLPEGEFIRIMCPCGAMSPPGETIGQAITSWNKRTGEPK